MQYAECDPICHLAVVKHRCSRIALKNNSSKVKRSRFLADVNILFQHAKKLVHKLHFVANKMSFKFPRDRMSIVLCIIAS